MVDLDYRSKLDPQTLINWLEWAAVRLIAMPAGKLKPTGYRTYWPDIPLEALPGLDDLQVNRIRALAPSSAEIPIVDQIVILPNLCDHIDTRRVIHWRAQVHPIKGYHLLKWDWIAGKLRVHRYTAQRWYKDGLKEVAEKTPDETVCRIAAFLDDRL